jgi:hypothetical protein
MLVENIYRIVDDSEFIYLYSLDEHKNLWCGISRCLPLCYMNYNVVSIYTHVLYSGSCLVINIETT